MAISPLPPSPAPTDTQQDFDAKAFALVEALNTFVTEANTLASDANDNAGVAAAAADVAVTKASEASTSAGIAAATASAVAWVSGTTYAYPQTAISPTTWQTYRKKTASSVSVVDPATDTANWEPITTKGALLRSERTSNVQIGPGDRGKLIDLTSGAFTQTFGACATLGDGWWCFIRNGGTGDVILDPSGAETIDGLTSYIMYPGECRLVMCDGSTLRTVIITPFFKVFTASGTFHKPPGYALFGCRAWGGGASGTKNSVLTSILGGGGGACAMAEISAWSVSATELVTIGSGGAAITVDETSGDPGGNSSFGDLVTAYGGGVVTGGAAFFSGVGTSGSNGNAVYGAGIRAYLAGGSSSIESESPGITVWGGASGGSINSFSPVALGITVFGGVGGAASVASNGADGSAPGGGGGATKTGTRSGAGARGELHIWGIL